MALSTYKTITTDKLTMVLDLSQLFFDKYLLSFWQKGKWVKKKSSAFLALVS